MIRAITTIAAGVCLLAAIPFSAYGAELLPPTGRIARGPSCPAVWRCGLSGCRWYRECLRGCPDRISCYPLYGAYGPYGGVAYWGAYDVWTPYPSAYTESIK